MISDYSYVSNHYFLLKVNDWKCKESYIVGIVLNIKVMYHIIIAVLIVQPTIMCLYSLSSVLWCSLRCSVHLYLQLFVGGLISYLRYLCLFAYSGVFFCLVCLCPESSTLVYPMFPVSLDCPFFYYPFSVL